MIFEQVIDVIAGFLSFLAGLFDLPEVPAVVANVPTYVASVGSYMTGTGAWVPWSVLTTMLGVVGASFLAALVIRVIRIVASHLTGGGGGAA